MHFKNIVNCTIVCYTPYKLLLISIVHTCQKLYRHQARNGVEVAIVSRVYQVPVFKIRRIDMYANDLKNKEIHWWIIKFPEKMIRLGVKN